MSSCNNPTGLRARYLAPLLAALLLLGACGFEPVYGTGGSATALNGQVGFADPEDRNAYLLAQGIESRLGRGANPAYRLKTDVNVQSDDLAVSADGQITRYNLVGSVEYTLTDSSNGDELATGRVDNFTGYSATGSTVATLAAERDARQRLMDSLADQIVDRLILSVPAPS